MSEEVRIIWSRDIELDWLRITPWEEYGCGDVRLLISSEAPFQLHPLVYSTYRMQKYVASARRVEGFFEIYGGVLSGDAWELLTITIPTEEVIEEIRQMLRVIKEAPLAESWRKDSNGFAEAYHRYMVLSAARTLGVEI